MIDLIGQKFGRLTIIKKDNSNKRGIFWLCKCDCGIEKVIYGEDIRQGKTKSCGCLRREGNHRRLVFGLSSMRQAIGQYKVNAKKRGCVWDLTEEQFKKITQKDCYYCGTPPSNVVGQRTINNGIYTYNGIDRVDNTKGYTIDNVVPCCRFCNAAKGKRSLQEYKSWIEKSYNKIFSIGRSVYVNK